jgi:hypothetical protein
MMTRRVRRMSAGDRGQWRILVTESRGGWRDVTIGLLLRRGQWISTGSNDDSGDVSKLGLEVVEGEGGSRLNSR